MFYYKICLTNPSGSAPHRTTKLLSHYNICFQSRGGAWRRLRGTGFLRRRRTATIAQESKPGYERGEGESTDKTQRRVSPCFPGSSKLWKSRCHFLKSGSCEGFRRLEWNGEHASVAVCRNQFYFWWKIITPSDVAIYGTLCALASYPRNQLKSQLLENETFSIYLEQEPQMREIIESFMSSKYKAVIELLDKYSVCLPPSQSASI